MRTPPPGSGLHVGFGLPKAMRHAISGALSFSIVVPSFNQVRFIRHTLDSILDQDYRPLQVIVVDGASQDGTQQILQEYSARHPEVKWISEPDEGPADAVNKGLRRANGDIIGIQSSDDIYYPGAFETAAEVFRAQPDCGLIYGDIAGIDEQGELLYVRRYPDFSWEAYFARSMTLQQGSIFFRRSLAEEVGGWDRRYYSCDIEYWLRLIFRTRPSHISRVLSGWRRHGATRTRPEHTRLIWDDYWRIIDESPDIAAAPLKIRRLAEASKHLLALRFPPNHSQFLLWWHLLLGLFLHPGYWRYNPRGMLLKWLPGSRHLRRLYVRLRTRLGLKWVKRDTEPSGPDSAGL